MHERHHDLQTPMKREESRLIRHSGIIFAYKHLGTSLRDGRLTPG